MATLVSSWSNNVETMPADYIMPPERRPGKFVADCKDIPVIDLGGQAGDHQRADLIQQILRASEEFGLFQVINHGVPEDIIQETKSLYKEVFNMSAEDKENLYSEDFTKDCRLYTSGLDFRKEEAHLWKDTLKHACYPLDRHLPSWPEKPAGYKKVVTRYVVEVRKLGLRILDLMGEGLGLQKGYFEGELTHNQGMATNYYPPCPNPSLTMGIHGHTDPNLITLLQQDVAGLQILKDGQWIGIEALPNAFVVNGGYQLQIISNGRLKSAEHRGVTNSTAARTSIVTFLGPLHSTVVQPAKEIVTAENPPKYNAFTYGEFQMNYLGYLAKKLPRVGTPLDPYMRA